MGSIIRFFVSKCHLRAKHRDTPPLQFNQQLCEDAQNYAEKLAATGQRGHDEAELNQKGNTIFYRLFYGYQKYLQIFTVSILV